MLVHHADAQRDSIARTRHPGRLSVDQNLARVPVHQAIEHVHKSRLSGPVLPDHSVDLALANIQVDVVIGHHAGPGLGDATHLDRQGLVGHSVPGA